MRPTTYCLLLPTTYSLLTTTYYILPNAYYLLSTAYFLLLTACYLLPNAYYLLSTAYFLLLTACYLLPTTTYPPSQQTSFIASDPPSQVPWLLWDGHGDGTLQRHVLVVVLVALLVVFLVVSYGRCYADEVRSSLCEDLDGGGDLGEGVWMPRLPRSALGTSSRHTHPHACPVPTATARSPPRCWSGYVSTLCRESSPAHGDGGLPPVRSAHQSRET